MSNDTTRNTIEPEGTPRDGGDGESGNARDTRTPPVADRGMPDLGQLRGRPRTWWLTPLAIVVVVAVGAVWTVHGFLARHDAAAKARRDAALDQPSQGRVFGDEASSVGVPASVPSMVASRPPARVAHAMSGRSYYDAPLLAGGAPSGGVADAAGAPTGPLDDKAAPFAGASVPNVGVSPLAATRGQTDSSLGQALTPTLTPRVSAGRLGNRSLILAQGAKIDCAGDTAFDSSEAGLSTCTVTRNVYSDDGRVVLIERGSQINSQYRSNLSPGQKRVFILSARIKTPNGVTVEIDSPAADALGRTGIGGYVNNHWGERVGAAFLLSITQDAIGYLATRGGNNNSSTVFENTQQTGNNMAARVLDGTINIAPTLTQNQGAEFTIVLARDLDFSSVYALQPEALQ
ncbi:type IV secretion system protein VirB10 [Caballeronia sp. SEWSISQ10-4 2]|uniref:type IV secretion system protein VirB10 n=1 Tax=Caballeronia sp. SEWSISQ10-4 2 TaxID=2937438 RepID=UPI00264F6ACD|nr:type IV secretion system protein VirB10 [Caballeronia sp. SEWSISQ10-4 2]MDN7179372.1 type IV secretion system protein VirB10 [Caballeronia sp. SEWSISQ10-4 2]